jgi:hypothetical protein
VRLSVNTTRVVLDLPEGLREAFPLTGKQARDVKRKKARR